MTSCLGYNHNVCDFGINTLAVVSPCFMVPCTCAEQAREGYNVVGSFVLPSIASANSYLCFPLFFILLEINQDGMAGLRLHICAHLG